jgi:hypothetical protein
LRLTGVYFDLTVRVNVEPAPGRRGIDANRGGSRHLTQDRRRHSPHTRTGDFDVLISVAKRLVPSAVRRNTVKRIVREAWRAAGKVPVGMGFDIGQSTQATSSGSARENEQSMQGIRRPATIGGRADGGKANGREALSRVCLVRLKRYPGGPVKSGPGVSPKTGAAAIRRSLRADADRLFASFLTRQTPEAANRRSAMPSGDGQPAAS